VKKEEQPEIVRLVNPPIFSAYVVVPVPPHAAEIIVPTASPINARPRYGSRLCPVIAPTAFTCPRFSPIRTITTGTIEEIPVAVNTG
jgi:hypothetical protein